MQNAWKSASGLLYVFLTVYWFLNSISSHSQHKNAFHSGLHNGKQYTVKKRHAGNRIYMYLLYSGPSWLFIKMLGTALHQFSWRPRIFISNCYPTWPDITDTADELYPDLRLDAFTPRVRVLIEAYMVVNNLKEFWWLRYTTCFQLWPNRNIIKGDLKCTCRNELTLNGITEKEDHHTGIDFVVHKPRPPGWSFLSKPLPHVNPGNDHYYEEEFGSSKHLRHPHLPIWRRVVVPQDGDFRIFFSQDVGILLKNLLVTSRVTIQNPERGSHQVVELECGWLLNASRGGYHSKEDYSEDTQA